MNDNRCNTGLALSVISLFKGKSVADIKTVMQLVEKWIDEEAVIGDELKIKHPAVSGMTGRVVDSKN